MIPAWGGDDAAIRAVFEATAKAVRSALGLRRVTGAWTIAHQHVSVPVEMPNGRAMLGLQP